MDIIFVFNVFYWILYLTMVSSTCGGAGHTGWAETAASTACARAMLTRPPGPLAPQHVALQPGKSLKMASFVVKCSVAVSFGSVVLIADTLLHAAG